MKKRKQRYWIYFLIVIAIASCISYEKTYKSSRYLKIAPHWTLEDLNGESHASSEFRDKVLLINFWETRCIPCKTEIPLLLELKKKFSDKEFQIIGIALEDSDPGIIHAFAQGFNITDPILIGNADVVAMFGDFKEIPTSFLIDKKGNIIKYFKGPIPTDIIETEIKNLITTHENKN